MVLADMSTLETLPARELSAGLAEVIKYALIMDVDFLAWLEVNMAAMMALGLHVLSDPVQLAAVDPVSVVSKRKLRSPAAVVL